MKTALSILVLLLLTFSGVAFAQEAESAPSESAAVESPAPASESESTPESSDAAPAIDAPESAPVELDAVVVEENTIEVAESTIEVVPESIDLVGPMVDFLDDKDGIPADDATMTDIILVGPVTDASDNEIIVTTGPILQPCLVTGPCGDDRPPHVAIAQGPATAKPCKMNDPTNCTPNDQGDDDTPVVPSETESSSNGSSGGSDDDFLFHPAWNPFTGVGQALPPSTEATQLVTSAPETTGSLSEEGPDPAIVALADGRPKPPVLIVNEIPAPSPATGLFTGANASLIGTGILLLLGAFVIFRSRKK